MRKHQSLALVLLVLLAYAGASSAVYAKDKSGDTGRMLTGKVMDHEERPLANAVVYLSNPRTRAVSMYTSHSTVVRLTGSDTLDGGEVLPGFTCRVAELFV